MLILPEAYSVSLRTRDIIKSLHQMSYPHLRLAARMQENLSQSGVETDAASEQATAAISAPDNAQLSPLMRQYWDIKAQHPDVLLFFRLGDFYELFDNDAQVGARELDITLTG